MDFARFGRFWGAPDGKIRVFRSLLRFVVVLERLEFIFSTKLIGKEEETRQKKELNTEHCFTENRNHWKLKSLTVEIPWCFYKHLKSQLLEKRSCRGRGFNRFSNQYCLNKLMCNEGPASSNTTMSCSCHVQSHYNHQRELELAREGKDFLSKPQWECARSALKIFERFLHS